MPLNSDKIYGDLINKQQKIIDQLTQMTKLLGQVNNEISKAGGIKELSTAIKKLNDNTSQYNKTVEQAIKIEGELKNVTNKQKDADLLLAKAKEEKRRASKGVTEQAKKEIAEEKNEIGTLQKLINRNKELQAKKKTLNLETKKGRIALNKANKEIDKNNKVLKKNSDALTKQKMGIGDYSQALGPLGRGLQTINRLFKLLIANPIVALFAALAAAIIGLVKLFKDTDEAGTQMQARFDAIKGVATLLKGVIVDLAGVFNLLIQGKFKQAFQEFNDVMSDFKDTASETYTRIVNVTIAMDALEDRITASISSQSELLKDFREYINLSKDQTKSDADRAKFLTLAEDAAKKYYGNLRDFENDRFNLEVEKQAARVGIEAETLAEFIKLSGEEAEVVRQNNEDIKKAWNILGDEVVKSLEDQYVKAIDADTMYFKRTNEITSLRTGLLRKMNTERLKAQEEYIGESLSLDEEFLQEELDNINELIEADNAAIDAKITKEQEETAEYLRLQELKKQAIEEIKNLGINAANETFNFIASLNNREIELTNRKYNDKIEAAKKAGRDTTKLEQQQALEIAKINRKQAILDKTAALFDIAINTAIAVTKVTAQTGVGAVIAIPLVIASGALQAASVLAQPLPEIPSYFKGGDHEGGPAIIHGKEKIKTKEGDFYTNWGKYEGKRIDLPESTITSNKDIIQSDLNNIVQQGNAIDFNGGISKDEFEKIMDDNAKKLDKSIRNMPRDIYQGLTKQGVIEGNNINTYRDRRFRHVGR